MPERLDTLVIDVSANTASATKNIQNLTSKIRTLKNVFNSINSGKDSLAPLYEGLKSIATLDFSKSIDGLREVSSILKSLETKGIGKELANIVNTDKLPQATQETGDFSSGGISRLVDNNAVEQTNAIALATQRYNEALEELSRIDMESNQQGYASALNAVNMAYNQIDLLKRVEEMKQINEETFEFAQEAVPQVVSGFAKIGLTSNQIEQVYKAIERMENDMSLVDPSKFDEIEKVLIKMGYTAEQTASVMSHLGKETEKSGDKAGKAKTKFGKFLQSLKRIAVYRAIRRALQLIVNAFKEGIQAVAQFDEATNKAMSNLKSSLTYLKNSLGAVVAPLIQMLEPLLTWLIDGIAEAFNKIAEYLAVMNGQATFTKAIKGAEDYAESLKKAKNASLGIDELNVLSGNDTDISKNFETAEVSQEVQQSADTLMALASELGGFIHGILDVVGDIVIALMPLIKSLTKLIVALEPVLDLIVWVLDDVVVPIVDYAMTIISGIVDIVSTSFDIAFTWIKDIGQLLGVIFTGNFDLAGKLVKKLGADFLNMWISIGETIINFFIRCINKITQGLSGLWTWIGIPAIPQISQVSFSRVAFAKGGFPEDGLFFANHNEMVGKFTNGKTAVANNEQIVEGIKQGVIEAMSESNGNGSNVVVYLDSNQIASRVEENINRKSARIYKGAFAYGK